MYGCCYNKKVKMTHRWYEPSEKMPEEDRLLICMDSGGAERELIFHKNLFWLSDMSMYVYFTPTRWRYA